MSRTGFSQSLSVSSLRGIDSKVSRLLADLTRVKGYATLPKSLIRDLKLVILEAVTNAFEHGACSTKRPCRLTLRASPLQIQIQVEDHGPGFDPEKKLRKPPASTEPSGRGLWIMKNLVDQIAYRGGRTNRLSLVRKLSRPKNLDTARECFDLLQESIQGLKPTQSLYDDFIDFIVDRFNVERASFLLFDAQEKALKVAVSRGISRRVADRIAISPGEGIAGYVFQTSRPLLVNNFWAIEKHLPQPRIKGYTTRSFVSVPVITSPLHSRQEAVGVLNLTDKRDGSRFNEEDLKLLNLMAGQAASAFQIRNLIGTVQQHERRNKEFEIVREIQHHLIPQSFPSTRGLRIGARCQLGPSGGGDFYDVIQVGDRLRGVIADVSGHHVDSAMMMASFRSLFRVLVKANPQPGRLLKALREAVADELLKLEKFISCWLFDYDLDGTLRIAGAGHPPVLLFQAATRKWSSHYTRHLPLGVDDASHAQSLKLKLAKGDQVFFYTDGLFDPRMRSTGFDRARFFRFVEDLRDSEPSELIAGLFEELATHRIFLPTPDDVAVLTMRKD